MVRFQENALIIEIPCEGDSVQYYQGLQNALYEVFWLGTSNMADGPNAGLNWLAAYLGPALAQLEPAANDVLTEMAQTKMAERPLETANLTDEDLLKLIRSLSASQFESLLNQLKSL